MLSSSSADLHSLRLGFRPALTRPPAPRPAVSSAAFPPPFLLKARCLSPILSLVLENATQLLNSPVCSRVVSGLAACTATAGDIFFPPRQLTRKLSVPLPGSLGLVHLGKGYLVLTAFCFAAMGNGVNLTDGLEGLAGGVAAWAFIAMSVVVLAICPDLAIFGASMAGACVGFLFHNRYKASVFIGDTGSLALGGALAAMASCTGMFIPLFITSGVFVMEALSVVVQVSYVKLTRWLYGESKRFFRMAPVHHHFELRGIKGPIIVASAYFMSCILALCAAYIGLISA